ncbi:hypothetical protein QWA_18297 [Alcaligenes faecalis subsp. faecalis NCIB 8687]|nr:hypothetical protein QWA_18297 [Alcaligenes faecalis subsp. faecalis NCIB 8687]
MQANLYRSQERYRWEVNDARPAQARYQGERRNLFTIKGPRPRSDAFGPSAFGRYLAGAERV